MAEENIRGRVSLARSRHRATSCSSISRRPTRPWPLPLSFSLCRSFSLFFSSSTAYHTIGGEDSLLVSLPHSVRFSRAPSRGTDWTIHHRCFSLILPCLSPLSPSLLSVLSSLYCQGVERTLYARLCAHIYNIYIFTCVEVHLWGNTDVTSYSRSCSICIHISVYYVHALRCHACVHVTLEHVHARALDSCIPATIAQRGGHSCKRVGG